MQNINYITVISPVKEVTLWGKAEAKAWQATLKEEGLTPLVRDGKVEIMISTVDSKYMGFRFQELSIAVLLAENEYFFPHAYNSIPLFALAERKFFQTPYYAGKLVVEKNRLLLNEGKSFEAILSPEAACLKTGEEDWKLTIRLPKALRKKADKPHFFYARLQGYTETYQADLESLSMDGEEAVFQILRESQFQPIEWRVRAKAIHSKSATSY
jgi:hypothetical protein